MLVPGIEEFLLERVADRIAQSTPRISAPSAGESCCTAKAAGFLCKVVAVVAMEFSRRLLLATVRFYARV